MGLQDTKDFAFLDTILLKHEAWIGEFVHPDAHFMVHEAPTPSHFQGAMVNGFSHLSCLSHTAHLTHPNFLDEEILTSNEPGIFCLQTPKSPLNRKQDACSPNQFMLLLGAAHCNRDLP